MFHRSRQKVFFSRSADAIFGKIGRTASEEVTLKLLQVKMHSCVSLWFGMFFITKEWFEIVRLCCHPFSYEIVQDIIYGNNSRMSELFWILSPK